MCPVCDRITIFSHLGDKSTTGCSAKDVFPACSLMRVVFSSNVSVSSIVLMNSSLFSLLLCLAAGQRAGLGNTFKLKIAQQDKVLKEYTLQITG